MDKYKYSSNIKKLKLIALLILIGTSFTIVVFIYFYYINAISDPAIKIKIKPTNNLFSAAQTAEQSRLMQLTPSPTFSSITDISSLSPTPYPLLSPLPTFSPADWENLPVIPDTTGSAIRDIYTKGLSLGNKPNSFSKVGDCNSLDPYFMSYFDLGSSAYDLGNYTYLQPIINEFSGSFKRVSEAVGDGFNTSAVLSPLRANPDDCQSGESPLQCEYRIQRPSFAFISIGTDDYLSDEKYESNMRQILEYTIQKGIVPILVTKMDNANQLNYNPILAKLANEYNIPLINLWRVLQPLPEHGLLDDIHPSGYTDAFTFTEEYLSRYGWPNRNLVFLRGLYTTWVTANQE